MSDPQIISAALIERNDAVLAAHRKPGRPPFAGQWLLPMTPVKPTETAEDAARRHAQEQFGVDVARESFVDTVYMDDPDDNSRYITNIFRTELGAGPMRFRADGDYDDARWLAATDLPQLWMPPVLRDAVVRILTDPEFEPDADWSHHSAAADQATPLAEHDAAAATALAPDNRAAWNAIATAYQDERYGERFGERLMWSWRASEDDLHVLDDVRGKRALAIGCGGGQDVVALCKLGAVAVGVDASAEQIMFAKRFAVKHSAHNASFVEGAVEDLSRFDDESFDLAISIHVLDYVEDIGAVLAEAARVLGNGGVLAIAVKHPYDVRIEGEGGPPFRVWTSYWTREYDWTWQFKAASGRLRSYFRTVGEWFDAITSAGFVIERLIEPKEDDLPKAEDDVLDDRWMALMPYTLVIKARKR